MRRRVKIALHQKLAMALRRKILAGAFDTEGRLPDETTLARRFGVSRVTISRVMLDLKTAGLIETRAGTPARISRFAKNATGVIGIIDPGRQRGPVLSSICSRMADLAEQSGWRVERRVIAAESPSVRADEMLDIVREFSEQRVSGVVMQPLEFQDDSARINDKIVAHFERCGMPVVLIDYDYVHAPQRSRCDLVSIDNIAAGQRVANLLIARGARRIGFLLSPNAPSSVVDRLHGVALAVLDAGLAWMPARQILCSALDNRRAIAAFVKAGRFDALVCGNDAAALRLKSIVSSLRDVKMPLLGGFDGLESARRAAVITVSQPCDDLAYVAMQTLLSRIKYPNLPTRTICLSVEAE